MKSKYLKYAKNLTTYFGASLIPMVLSLIANPWIAKNMAPDDYAISGYYTSYSSLIGPIIIFYLIHYYIKEYFRRDEDERRRLFAMIAKATIWFSGIVSVVCFVAIFIYLRFINEDLTLPIMPYLAFMVFSLPLTGLLNLQLAQYRMEKRANAFFRLSVCNGLLNVMLTIVFVVWIKWGAFGKLLGPLICNASIFFFLLWKLRDVFKIPTPIKEFKTILIFCLPLAASATLGYFTHGFSTTYLESVGDVTEYGIYVVGASIGAYLTVFSTAIGNTFQPDLYESTINKQWRRFTKFCCLQIGIIGCVVVLFILLAPFIISILTADRYNASTPYAQIIAISTLTSAIYYLVNNYSIATNRPKMYLYTSIIGSAIIILAMPYAVDNWAFVGGAWVSVLSYVAFTIINLGLLVLAHLNKLPKILK